MKSLTILLLLTFATFGYGVAIGYMRIPEPMEPDLEPKPMENIEPNVMERLYYTKLIPLLLAPITPKNNRHQDFGGFGGFGLRFWKTSL